MSFIRNLPFTGSLHEVHLVNFSIAPGEIVNRLPAPLRPRLIDGRAMISMVDVHLRNMRPGSRWLPFRFDYQHVAFRLLVHDEAWTEDGQAHGIYFLDSFTARPLLGILGNLFTDYRFQSARIVDAPTGVNLSCDGKELSYCTAGREGQPSDRLKELQGIVGGIDRAYAVHGNDLLMTRIMRERWPLQALHPVRFHMDFFTSARLEGIFKVTETIHYQWLRPEIVASSPDWNKKGNSKVPALAAMVNGPQTALA